MLPAVGHTALTKSLAAPSTARLDGRNAAVDGGLSVTRHNIRQMSMDFIKTLAEPTSAIT